MILTLYEKRGIQSCLVVTKAFMKFGLLNAWARRGRGLWVFLILFAWRDRYAEIAVMDRCLCFYGGRIRTRRSDME